MWVIGALPGLARRDSRRGLGRQIAGAERRAIFTFQTTRPGGMTARCRPSRSSSARSNAAAGRQARSAHVPGEVGQNCHRQLGIEEFPELVANRSTVVVTSWLSLRGAPRPTRA